MDISRDAVTLYFGALGAPRAVLTVRPDGRLEDTGGQAAGDQDAGKAGRGAQRVRVARSADRWTCWVPIPAGAIESMFDRHVVRVGIMRTDPRGERSAWPRPMLPWQVEPGRVIIDLSEWSSLGR